MNPKTDVGTSSAARAGLAEEREFLLRSLRDLEAEHAAGDLDEADYLALKDDYTVRAAAVLRAISGAASPVAEGPAAETTVTEPLAQAGVADDPGPKHGGPVDGGAPRTTPSKWRRTAIFFAAGLIIIGGIIWAITAATGTRGPGEVDTGQAVGQGAVDQLLTEAQTATSKGDALTAIKDYQKVLAQDPSQVDALTGEGWLLAETQQPQLLEQGVGLLTKAIQTDPTYAPARVYRGIAYLTEDDYADSVTDLSYYLAHDPDPSLVANVKTALAQAQKGLASQRSTPTTTAPGT